MGAGFAFVTTSPIPENVFSLSSLASLENKIQATTARKNKAPLVRGFGFKIL